MMYMRWSPLALVGAAVLGLPGCTDDPTGPDPRDEPLRTVLVHRQDTGENQLWDTDGTAAGELAPVTRGMLPIATHPREGSVALIDGTAVVLATRSNPELLDTILRPAPASLSLATFSQNGRYVALVAYAPVPGLLLYDRANRSVDTLSMGDALPVLPPMFSPDDSRIALIALNELSILVTIVPVEGQLSPTTRQLSVSRFRNLPVFGWPQWGDAGLQLAFRRVAEDGPDTLLVGVVDPDVDGALLDERFRVLLSPDNAPTEALDLSLASTYAFTTDGTTLVLGAVPGNGAPHGVFIATARMSRVRPLLDAVGQTPVYPLFIRE